MATLDEINKAYATALGRSADSGGADYYANSGMNYEQILNSMYGSQEYAAKNPNASSGVGFNSSGVSADQGQQNLLNETAYDYSKITGKSTSAQQLDAIINPFSHDTLAYDNNGSMLVSQPVNKLDGSSNVPVTLAPAKTQSPAIQTNYLLSSLPADMQNPTFISKGINTKTFMDATGASFQDASNLLYGDIGSNKDYRNWDAIMSSSDPLQAAKDATKQMFGGGYVAKYAPNGSGGFTTFIYSKNGIPLTSIGSGRTLEEAQDSSQWHGYQRFGVTDPSQLDRGGVVNIDQNPYVNLTSSNQNLQAPQATQATGNTNQSPSSSALQYSNQASQPLVDGSFTANELKTAAIANSSSPLVQQAMSRARQSFAGRGLLNSSMAEEAAQEADISKALEIAQPDTAAYYADSRDAKQFDYNKALAELGYAQQDKMAQLGYAQQDKMAQLGYAQQDKMARLNNDLSLANAQSQYNMKVGDTTHTNYLTMIDRIQSDATKQVQQINASAMPYDEKVKAIDSIQAQSQASIANSNELFKTMNGWQNEWAVAANSYNWNVPSPDPKPVSNPPISSDNSPSS
jgi:hypothetical protein